jgi:large subunit ribosomal protein L12
MEYIYSALLLHKLGKEITEENVKSVVKSTGAVVNESKVKSLVVSLKGVDISKELESASLIAAAPVAHGAAPAEKKEEAHEEEKHESAAEGLSSLFG